MSSSAVAVKKNLIRLYATVKAQKGSIDILFANAGVGQLVTLGEITEAQFDKTFGINVKGLLFTVQKALPLFHDGGSIILNASVGESKGVVAKICIDIKEIVYLRNLGTAFLFETINTIKIAEAPVAYDAYLRWKKEKD
jgi:NAD(P)-dependent dehydrogenase (short-subunit alcohol dehydrogenase family)